MATVTRAVGAAVDRIEGGEKVSGQAHYAYEYDVDGVVYGAIVQSTIAKGSIRSLDASEALVRPGVIAGGIFAFIVSFDQLPISLFLVVPGGETLPVVLLNYIRFDLDRAIARLPEGARTVFVLYAIEGYQHDEIAEMTGIAEGTSRAQYHTARTLLKKELS